MDVNSRLRKWNTDAGLIQSQFDLFSQVKLNRPVIEPGSHQLVDA